VQDSFRRCFRDSSSWQGEAEGWPWSPSANLGRWPPPCPLPPVLHQICSSPIPCARLPSRTTRGERRRIVPAGECRRSTDIKRPACARRRSTPAALQTANCSARVTPPSHVSPSPQQAPPSCGLSSSASRVTGRGPKPGRRWRALAAARVWKGVRERERRGSGSGWHRADPSPLSIAKPGDRR
jgi:hypothetical protein